MTYRIGWQVRAAVIEMLGSPGAGDRAKGLLLGVGIVLAIVVVLGIVVALLIGGLQLACDLADFLWQDSLRPGGLVLASALLIVIVGFIVGSGIIAAIGGGIALLDLLLIGLAGS